MLMLDSYWILQKDRCEDWTSGVLVDEKVLGDVKYHLLPKGF